MPDMSHLLHITTAAAWASAKAAGHYTADSFRSEGFIHCSERQQVVSVANRRFRGRMDLVLLHIDPSRLHAAVLYENLEGGQELFPHIYGPIPLDAVVEVTPFEPLPDGTFSA